MADRLLPKTRQRAGVFIFSIQRSFASCVKSILTPFHRTRYVLIASGCSHMLASRRPFSYEDVTSASPLRVVGQEGSRKMGDWTDLFDPGTWFGKAAAPPDKARVGSRTVRWRVK